MNGEDMTDAPGSPRPVDVMRELRAILALLHHDSSQFDAMIQDLASDEWADGAANAVTNLISLLADTAAGGLIVLSGGDREKAITDCRAQLIELENEL